MNDLPRASWLERSPWGLSIAAAIICSTLIFGDRILGERIFQPLTYDELLTMENYTWVAFEPGGTPLRIRRADQIRSAPAPTATQLVAGLYRAFSVWREPNDHIPHSLLVNFATAALSTDERSVRLSAWIGGVVFTISMAWLVWLIDGKFAWPAALILATTWPFVQTFSLQARGYTWMLAFQALLLILLLRLRRAPASIALGALSVTVAILSFWNIVSLSVDWLLPLYLGLWLFPSFDCDSPEPKGSVPGGESTFRRNLLIQVLVLGLIGGLFLANHLPYLWISAQEFGLPITESGFLGRCREILDYLLPSAGWRGIALVSLAGWIDLARRSTSRHLGAICGLTVGVSAAHFVLSGTVPYPRTCGYFIPLFILGFTHLVSVLLRSVPAAWAGGAQLMIAAVLVLFGAAQYLDLREANSPLTAFRQVLQRSALPGRPYLVMRDGGSYVLTRHLPTNVVTATDDVSDIRIATSLGFMHHSGDPSAIQSSMDAGQGRSAGPIHLEMSPALVRSLSDDLSPERYPAVTIWVPDPTKTGIRNERFYDALADLGSRCFWHHRKIFNKLEFSNQVFAVECVSSNPEEFDPLKKAILSSLGSLGGEALLIEPTTASLPAIAGVDAL